MLVAPWGLLGLYRIRLHRLDAHRRDPLGQIELQDADFHWITRQICDLATDTSKGRVVSILEGGYDLQALATASRSHVQALTC